MRLINADAFMQRLREDCEDKATREFVAEIHDLVEIEATFHPVEAESVRKGKWIWYYGPGHYYCSECGFCADGYTMECIDGVFKFCPKCGAKMESVENEELPSNGQILLEVRL